MGQLILRLFGTPEVSHAEQPLTFQTRKVLALLAFLAVEQGVHYKTHLPSASKIVINAQLYWANLLALLYFSLFKE